MRKKEKNIIMLFMVVIAFTMCLNAVMVMNNVICPFNGNESTKGIMESKMIDGASYFLQAHAKVLLLLNEVELAAKTSFNLEAAKDKTEKAILFLEGAKLKYEEVLEIAKSLGYNEAKREKFTTFDYTSYINTNGLNKEIAERVRSYLSTFDIIGLHNQNIENINGILEMLYNIRDLQKEGLKPSNNVYWELLHRFSDGLLFGNYSTSIGTTILSNCDG